MKAIVETRTLAALLNAANGIAPKDRSIQIKIIKADTSDPNGIIRVTAYDQGTVCAWEGPAHVHEEGSTAIRGASIERFLKASFRSDASVLLETKATNTKTSLRITTARGAHEFDLLSDDMFENIHPGYIDRPNGNLRALAEAMSRARSVCAGADEVTGARVVLAGVHVAVKGHEIHVVGTDSKRLAWSQMLASEHPSVAFEPSPRGYTIPGSLAQKIISMIADTPARIDFSPDSLVVANDAGTLALRLIDGAYPEYAPILKTPTPHHLVVSKERMLMAIGRSSATIGGDEKNSAATLIQNADGLHLVSATTQESSSETVSEKGGVDVSISFETSFMRKALAEIPSDDIHLHFGDHTVPIFLKCDTRPDILLIVMPCKASTA